MKSQFFTDTATVASNRVLYTASSFARSSLLHLQEIGELEALKAHMSERSGLQSYLFFVIVSGSGRLVYEDKEQKLEAGSVVFVDCRKSYSHRTDPENLWKLKWIHFYGPTINSIYEKYCERGGRAVFTPASSTAEQMEAVWNQLMSVASSDLYMRDIAGLMSWVQDFGMNCKFRPIGTPIPKLTERSFRSERYVYSGLNGTASLWWIS